MKNRAQVTAVKPLFHLSWITLAYFVCLTIIFQFIHTEPVIVGVFREMVSGFVLLGIVASLIMGVFYSFKYGFKQNPYLIGLWIFTICNILFIVLPMFSGSVSNNME